MSGALGHLLRSHHFSTTYDDKWQFSSQICNYDLHFLSAKPRSVSSVSVCSMNCLLKMAKFLIERLFWPQLCVVIAIDSYTIPCCTQRLASSALASTTACEWQTDATIRYVFPPQTKGEQYEKQTNPLHITPSYPSDVYHAPKKDSGLNPVCKLQKSFAGCGHNEE